MKIVSGALMVARIISGSPRNVLDDEIRFSLTVNEDGAMEVLVGFDTIPAPRRFRFATGTADIEIISLDEYFLNFSLISSERSPVYDILISEEDSRRSFIYGYGEISGSIGAMYGSDFANEVGSIMILPDWSCPIENLRSFDMIVRPVQPERYCLDNQIIFVNATMQTLPGPEQCMTIHVGVSLEPSSSLGEIFNVRNDTTPMFIGQYQIQTESEFDTIPTEIFSLIQTAIRSATGFSQLGDIINMIECESYIDELPSIRYTLLDGSVGGQGIVYVVLSPRDYTEISQEGVCKLRLRRSNQFVADRLGVNFLERVAVYIDYAEQRFAFCEPM